MQTLPSRFPLPRRGRGALVLLAAVAMLALPAYNAAAQPVVLDTHVPFSFGTTNPCTGEFFSGSGFYHQKVTIETAPNFHISVEFNIESAQGTTVSGVKYVVDEQQSAHLVVDTDSAPAN